MRALIMLYVAGALCALWRTDAPWPTRAALAVAWPIGPIAFVVTVSILLAASVIAFPLIGGLAGAALLAGWLVWG